MHAFMGHADYLAASGICHTPFCLRDASHCYPFASLTLFLTLLKCHFPTMFFFSFLNKTSYIKRTPSSYVSLLLSLIFLHSTISYMIFYRITCLLAYFLSLFLECKLFEQRSFLFCLLLYPHCRSLTHSRCPICKH